MLQRVAASYGYCLLLHDTLSKVIPIACRNVVARKILCWFVSIADLWRGIQFTSICNLTKIREGIVVITYRIDLSLLCMPELAM
jgi:hypothetical protein